MKRVAAALGLSGIGFYIAGAILLGILGGRWLDNKFNSEPVWLITGLIFGVLAAFWGVFNMIRPFISSNNNNKKGEG